MSDALIGILRRYPEVTFFLVLGLGYLLGKVKLGSFTIGAVTGTLLAGVAVGQLGVKLSADVKQCFFLLFLFSIGFRTGPQFFRGLKRDGLQQAALAAIVAVTGLVVAYVVARVMGYDVGTAAGVIAGSLTESATIGTASDAIARLGLPSGTAAASTTNIAVAFAVTYLVGVVGAAWFLSQLAPRIMRVNLKDECRKYEQEMQGRRTPTLSARREIEYRAYLVLPGSPFVGCRVRELEARAVADRIFIEQIRRGGRILDPHLDLVAQAGDTVALVGRREQLIPKVDEERLGLREVDDQELLDVPAETLDVVVTRGDADGRTIADLSQNEAARSVYIRQILRGGTPVGLFPGTTVQRGDVITLVGPARRIEAAVRLLGIADRATDVTDMVLVAFGIVAGALIGIPALHLHGIELGLSLSVGVLFGGLVCGWMRTMWPRFLGRIPSATLWVFESIGLTGFVAIVGLNAGPDFIAGLRSSGVSLLIAGALTVFIPHLVGVLSGRWIFRMQPGVLLGVCAGAGTATPALAAVQEAADSTVPTLGYGVAYAVGNVLLALWGTVIVALL